MHSVKVVKPFKRKGKTIHAGSIIEVPGDILPKLAGYVEPLPRRRVDQPADPQHILGEALAEMDRQGRPWPARFLVDMPAADRERLREIEQRLMPRHLPVIP